MSEYTAECNSRPSDRIRASREGDSIELLAEKFGEYAMEAYVTPAKARTFARGILALADEIDGGEVAEAAPKVGDKVRVVKDDPWLRTGEFVGKTGTLRSIGRNQTLPFNVQFDADQGTLHSSWNVLAVELVKPAPEPALADWERDLLEGSVPTRSPRAKYVEEAKELLSDKPAAVAQIIELAQWLADDE